MASSQDSSTVDALKERLYALQRRHEEDYVVISDLRSSLQRSAVAMEEMSALNATLKEGGWQAISARAPHFHCLCVLQCKGH